MIHPGAFRANRAQSLLPTILLTLRGINAAGSIAAFCLIDLLIQPCPPPTQKLFHQTDPHCHLWLRLISISSCEKLF